MKKFFWYPLTILKNMLAWFNDEKTLTGKPIEDSKPIPKP